MNTVIRTGLVLGLSCTVWMFVVGFAGWYKDPALQALFWVVVPIEIGVLVWGLRQTAGSGRTYGRQVGAGSMISLLGGGIIFFGSLLFTVVVFPDYFEEIRTAGEEAFRTQGLSEMEIQTRMDQYASSQTPFMQALSGFLGTVVTGVLTSLVVAVFIRAKGPGVSSGGEAP